MSIQSQSGKVLFDSYNVTATDYVYNASGESDSEAGAVSARGDMCLVQIGLSALNASSLTYRIEGRNLTVNRWCNIYSENLSAVLSIDKIINVTENFPEIRVGVKLGTVATPNTFIAAVLLSEVK